MNVSSLERYEDLRFRITAWPGTRLALPAVVSGPCARDHAGETDVYVPLYPGDPRIPADHEFVRHDAGEIYLELLELDLEDRDAIFAFVCEYGLLGVNDPFREWPFFETLPALEGGLQWGLRKVREAAAPAIDRAAHATAQRVATVLGMDPPGPDEGLWATVETDAEFVVGAKYIRDAARVWIAIRSGEDPTALSFESPLESGSPVAIVDFMHSFFESGLEPFHPGLRLSMSGVFMDDDEAPLTERLEVVPAPSGVGNAAPLYSVCCAELYNHVVDLATYRICANETCGRRFVLQKGRSQYGQQRAKGVKYCTASCARAQAQREYRRRKASEAPEPARKRRQLRPRR